MRHYIGIFIKSGKRNNPLENYENKWYQDMNLPPENVTRFFIGKDIIYNI